MAQSSDVIVIGAGIIGCSVVCELARRETRVRVFDARAVGAGATQASAGVLAPFIEVSRPGPLMELGVRSLEMYDDFIAGLQRESGIAVEYRRSGTLEVAVDGTAAAQLRAGVSAPHLAAAGAEWLDASRARAVEPALPESIHGAVLVRSHAYVSATQLTEALAWTSLRYGAEFENGRRVTAVRASHDGVEVTSEDGAIWSADFAVIASGSWSGGIDGPPLRSNVVSPIRGQLLKLSWLGDRPRHIIWGPDCYVVPWSDGTVLVGATVEDVGFDERTTAAGVRDLLDAACELLPSVWGTTFLEARVGLRPATPDGMPIIGIHPEAPRIVYATGHYRNGVLLAPLTAVLVADLILGSERDPALESLKPDRFGKAGEVP